MGLNGVFRPLILNAFDVDPGAGERTLELHCVSVAELGLATDLLVLAGGPDATVGTAGRCTALLHELGLTSVRTSHSFDFRGNGINAWVSEELSGLSPGRVRPGTAFQRIAVLEDPLPSRTEYSAQWPAFRQLFCLLAILPLHGLNCSVVAMPLFGLNHDIEEDYCLFDDLFASVRNGFRHVPDLERLILFDDHPNALKLLAKSIDLELGQYHAERQLLNIHHSQKLIAELSAQLTTLNSSFQTDTLDSDIIELQHLLAATSISPVALGIHCRRLVERLVRHQLGGPSVGLNRGLRSLSDQGVSPWTISCLHQVRVFGNWMGHPSEPSHLQSVTELDLISILSALHRALESFPWL